MEKKHKGDQQAEFFGDMVIGSIVGLGKCVYYIGKGVCSYLNYSYMGIKKIVLSRLKKLRSKIVFGGLVLAGLTSIITIALIVNHKIGFNMVSLPVSLTGFIYLPLTNVFLGTMKNIEYHPNDDFIEYYDKMGFKEDFEKGLQYPYLLGTKEFKQDVIFTFKANMNKIDNFRKYADLLEEVTNLEFKDVRKNEENRSLIEVIFVNKDYVVERLDIKDVKVQEDHGDIIPISQEINWNPALSPHMFINGGTGGGKSFFIFYLVKIFLEMKAIIKILDPKFSDLSYLDDYLGSENVVFKHEDIADILINTVKDMFGRAEEIRKRPDKKMGMTYKDYGYKPVFVIFDEMMAFMNGGVDSKIKSEANKALTDIIAMGRQLGFFIIIAMQRGSTKNINGDLRGQLHFRCTLGKMDNDGYKMAFGDSYKLRKTQKDKGSGFVQIEDQIDEPEEFYTPYIDKG